MIIGDKTTASVLITTTRLTVCPGRRKEFFQTISPLTERIRKEDGCVSYKLYAEVGDENSLLLFEEWDAAIHWDEHRSGENYSVLLGLVTILSIRARLDFRLLAQIGGNEVIGESKPASQRVASI